MMKAWSILSDILILQTGSNNSFQDKEKVNKTRFDIFIWYRRQSGYMKYMCIYILSALDGEDFATLGSGLENLIPRNGIPDTLPDYDERMIQLLQMSC